MKIIKYLFSSFIILLLVTGCTKDKFNDLSFLSTATSPDKIESIFDISNDNSGDVTITPSGEGVGSFEVYFGDTTAKPAIIEPGNNVVHRYAEGNYNVKIVGKGITGLNTEKSYPLSVVYRAPENLAVTITKKIHHITVSAKADYAASYLVYFGDVTDEVATPLATGAEVSHDYASAGTYDVKVIALSGGAATTEKITATTIYDPFVFPITFENPNVNYFFGTFGGGQKFTKVDNPDPTGLNTSATVGMFKRGYESWSGTYSYLDAPIDFSKGNKIKILVYNPDTALIGKKLNVELESAVGGYPANGVAVLKVPLTKSATWEELTFDFSTIQEIPDTAKFVKLVLRFNDTSKGAGAIIYVDNFRFTK